MKKLLKVIFYFFFTLFALVFFIPKVNLYYMAEQELEKLAVVIDNEHISDSGFVVKISNADIYAKGIHSAKVESLNLTTYLFYNSIQIDNILLSETLKSFVPLKINTLSATQLFYNPMSIALRASGEFGEAWGSVDLLTRTLKINLTPSKLLSAKYRSTMKMLKKNKEGGYVYELTF